MRLSLLDFNGFRLHNVQDLQPPDYNIAIFSPNDNFAIGEIEPGTRFQSGSYLLKSSKNSDAGEALVTSKRSLALMQATYSRCRSVL